MRPTTCLHCTLSWSALCPFRWTRYLFSLTDLLLSTQNHTCTCGQNHHSRGQPACEEAQADTKKTRRGTKGHDKKIHYGGQNGSQYNQHATSRRQNQHQSSNTAQQPASKKKRRSSTHGHGRLTARAVRARPARSEDALQDSAFTMKARQLFSDDSLLGMSKAEHDGRTIDQIATTTLSAKRKGKHSLHPRKQQAF